jgi:Glycosyl transferase family 2
MKYSPIALFVYKRPEHTRRTIEALMRCPEFNESVLHVFCDGAKSPDDQSVVDQTRSVVRALVGDRAIMIESPENRGLANSIIAGVTQLVNEFGRVVVLEDDLVVSAGFLGFMNQALERYQDDDRVMQISGYMFPVPEFANRSEAIFLPFTVSWGWATWKRAWQFFDPESTGWELLRSDPKLRFRFNLNGSYNYFLMMKRQFNGECDSWAIRWYWSVFKMSGLVLFPPVTYIQNYGFDGSGTHGSWSRRQFEDPIHIIREELPHLPNILDLRPIDFRLVCQSIRRDGSRWLALLKIVAKKLRLDTWIM